MVAVFSVRVVLLAFFVVERNFSEHLQKGKDANILQKLLCNQSNFRNQLYFIGYLKKKNKALSTIKAVMLTTHR